MALKEKMRMKSPWILHFDTGSCNGCDLEVWALLAPKYDVVTKKTEDRLMTLYNQTPGPKVVVACGNCASNGVPFFDCYNVDGGIDRVIPVDVYVPGCACRPEAIIDGVVLAIAKWKEKVAAGGGESVPDKAKAAPDPISTPEANQ